MQIGTEHQPNGASVVYWIHKPEHTDITKQGYVGITQSMVRDRWIDHQAASRRSPDTKCAVVNRAIRKHSNLIYEVVLVADTREYCEQVEALLRPTNRIGWNIARGGMPVDTMMGGIANGRRWVKYWIDNPTKAADRWWNAERVMLDRKALAQRKASKPKPFTSDRKLDSRNKSGYTGVNWYRRYNKWESQICVNGKRIKIGYFDSQEDAHAKYLQAKEIYLSYREDKIDLHNAIEWIQELQSGY
jgi:hypothetical protein